MTRLFEIPLNEVRNAIADDVSGNGRNLDVHGAPEIVDDDRFERCLQINKGDSEQEQYLSYSLHAAEVWSTYTFSGWFWLEGAKTQLLYAESVVDLFIEDAQIRLVLGSGDTVEVPSPVKTARWTHMALAVDGKTAWLVVDGELVIGDATAESYAAIDRQQWRIGSYPDDSAYRLVGRMANLKLDDTALSTAEILREFFAESPLVGFPVAAPLEFELWDE